MKNFNIQIAVLLCLLSGSASLIYETLWIRVLSLGVGSTSTSLSLVLAIFFLGLSIGSFLAGRLSSSRFNSWKVYGIVELVIGLVGFILLPILLQFHQILALLPFTGSFSWVGTFAKAFLVLVFLIVPTIAMGATLPLMIRALLGQATDLGKTIAILYGFNTLGAVIGAFITSFVLIPQVGVFGANGVAVALNVLVFLVALILARRWPTLSFMDRQEGALRENTQVRSIISLKNWDFYRKWILLVSAVSGMSFVIGEVVWSKYLGVFFGSNIFGLGLILCLFLVGIAVGSLAISRWVTQSRSKTRLLFYLVLANAVSILLASYLLNLAPIASSILGYYFGATLQMLTIKALIAGLILLFPACLSGAIFPLCIELLRHPENTTQVALSGQTSDFSKGDSEPSLELMEAPAIVGMAYAVNTLGSIIGSCVAGLILIPIYGSDFTVRVSVVGLALTLVGLIPFLKTRLRFGYGGIVLAIIIVTFFTKSIGFKNIISAAYQQSTGEGLKFVEVLKYFSRDYEEFQLIVEGRSGLISLSHDPQDGENYRRYLRLKTNGLNESVYNLDDLKTLPKFEALLGFLPYLFERNPKTAFVVGYGGGYTVDFLTSTDLKSVFVTEIEEGILQAADVVHRGNNPILKRSNLNLEINDARFILAAKQQGPFDMILSQPSHSWLSGVANLFTQEFFEIVRERLTSQGIFSQWLNLYNMDEKVLKSILRTFFTVFPYGAVFTNQEDQELIMLGSVQPLRVDLKRLQALSENPKMRMQLSQVPFQSPYDLLSNFSLSRSDVMRVTVGAPLNTDINAYAEVGQSTLFYAKGRDALDPQKFFETSYTGNFGDLVSTADALTSEFFEGLMGSLKAQNRFGKMSAVLSQYERTFGTRPEFATRLGHWCNQMQRYPSAIRYLTAALEHSSQIQRADRDQALSLLMSTYISLGKFSHVIDLSKKAPGLRGNQVGRCYLSHALLKLGRSEAANSLIAELTRDRSKTARECGDYAHRVLGLYWSEQADYLKAIPELEAYYKVFSQDVEIVQALVVAYIKTGADENARSFAKYLETAAEAETKRLKDFSEFLRARGYAEDAESLLGLLAPQRN